MPVAWGTRGMKLLGTAFLLFLALLGHCCVDAQSNTTPPEASTTLGATESIPTATGLLIASNATSSMATSTSPRGDAANSTSNTTSLTITQPPPISTLASLLTSNNTVSAGMAESSAQSSVTSSSLALAVTGQSKKTTTGLNVVRNATQKSWENTLQKTAEAVTKYNTSGASSEKQDHPPYTTIILPVVIALIVISLSVFLLVALYKMCTKTTPERQENGTEQSPSDKENVKLISVKTTSPETGMSSFMTLSSYDLPLDMSFPLEPFKPM